MNKKKEKRQKYLFIIGHGGDCSGREIECGGCPMFNYCSTLADGIEFEEWKAMVLKEAILRYRRKYTHRESKREIVEALI